MITTPSLPLSQNISNLSVEDLCTVHKILISKLLVEAMNLVQDSNLMEAATALAELRKTHLEALASAPASSSPPTTSSFSTKKALPSIPVTKGSIKFPMRMHALLSDSSFNDAITWLPHGRSFVILRPDVLSTRVLPLYFTSDSSKSEQRGVRYTSFTRKLNRWGFRQISHGPDAGAFYHELFRREDPEACRGMGCAKSRKSTAKSVSSASTMSQTSNEYKPAVGSAAVTVSTSGVSLRSSLPLKKRRGLSSLASTHGIPSNVEMKPNNTSLLTKRTGSFESSLSAEEDPVPTAGMSSVSAVKSGMKNVTFAQFAKETLAYYFEQAKEAHNLMPRTVISASTVPSSTKVNATVTSNANFTADQLAITSAKQALARNFHEQYKAYTLASLLKNSQSAMAARGMDIDTVSVSSTSSPLSTLSRVQGQDLAIQPANVAVVENRPVELASQMHQYEAAAKAAKNELYEAFKNAISVNHP